MKRALIVRDAQLTATSWAFLIPAWRTHLQAIGRTAQTISTRTDHIERLSRQFATPIIPTMEFEAWAAQQHWALDTRRSFYASCKSFFTWAELKNPVVLDEPIKPSPPNPRPIPEAVLRAALAKADQRLELVLRLAAEAGLRRAEIAQLDQHAIAQAIDGPALTITGKGNKSRTVPISSTLASRIQQALDDQRYVFPGRTGHLQPRTLSAMARTCLPQPWSLHTLRHRFAAVAYASTRDLLAVQQLLGHSSPAVTQRYIPAPLETLRAAASAAALV